MIIRKASVYDATGIAKIHYNSWIETYEGIYADDFIEKVDFERTKKRWIKFLNEDHEIMVAEASDGRIVGFVKADIDTQSTKEAELKGIFVEQKYINSGLGKQLLQRCFGELALLEVEKVTAWLLKNDPYLDFFLYLGGEIVDQRIDRLGERDYVKLGIVWKDIKAYGEQLELMEEHEE